MGMQQIAMIVINGALLQFLKLLRSSVQLAHRASSTSVDNFADSGH